MSLTDEQIATAFSRHEFAATYPYLADDIVWDSVGNAPTEGREAVIAVCEQSAAYLADVTTTYRQFKVVVGDGTVVIDTRTEYRDADGEGSTVASCDLYDFADGRLVRITSYTVEVE